MSLLYPAWYELEFTVPIFGRPVDVWVTAVYPNEDDDWVLRSVEVDGLGLLTPIERDCFADVHADRIEWAIVAEQEADYDRYIE